MIINNNIIILNLFSINVSYYFEKRLCYRKAEGPSENEEKKTFVLNKVSDLLLKLQESYRFLEI